MTEPRWRRDGRELFYRSVQVPKKLMAATVEAGPAFRSGTPRPLFDDRFLSQGFSSEYDVSHDGLRFLMIEEPDAATRSNHFVVIPDFAGEVRAKLRAARK